MRHLTRALFIDQPIKHTGQSAPSIGQFVGRYTQRGICSVKSASEWTVDQSNDIGFASFQSEPAGALFARVQR
jgi:hypothetical protein